MVSSPVPAGVDYATLAGPAQLEQEIRKSRFLALAESVQTAEEALAFIEARRHAGANHHCWAYRIGSAYRFNDDGEPGGTAGKPILQAIEGQGLDGVVVLVVRWFGGIKLGTGGLIRAYGGCAAECLRLAARRTVVACVTAHFQCGYGEQGAVRQKLALYEASDIRQDFGNDRIAFTVQVPAAHQAGLAQALADITRGQDGFSLSARAADTSL